MSAPRPERTILFFDGVCGLCNRLVDYLLAHDHRRNLRFAPLQGETFQTVTKDRPDLRQIDSVIILHETADGTRKEFRVRSRAVLFAFSRLGGGWRLVRALEIIPWSLSDVLYRFIARIRYAVWGKYERCRIPTPSERDVFLP